MRLIPIYDTSSPDGIKRHIAEWDDVWLNEINYDGYTKAVCQSSRCKASQHLEISKNSIHRFGRQIRMASLNTGKGDDVFSCESLFQGSKVSIKKGNRHWLYSKTGNRSLKEKSKIKNERIISIDFFGFIFPISSLTDLHDLLYWLGFEYTVPDIESSLRILNEHGINFFTDCFDSPGKAGQSRSFSKYFWGWKNKKTVWDFLTKDQKEFLYIIKNNSFKMSEHVVRKNVVMKALF